MTETRFVSVPKVWPDPIDLHALLATDPQPPAMIIDDWLPCGYATMFAGHGGSGKSSIALRLAVSIALGRPFFGLPVQQRRVLYLSCEDRADVLHWRLRRILDGDGIAALSGITLLDLVGHETILIDAHGATTKAYHELRRRMEGHDVLIVDGVADTFGGNENARAEVKRFVNALLGLVPPTGAVLLLHHVNRQSASGNATEGYSGSTGWHNSVRARWYLYPETERDDEGVRATGSLLLDLQKSNLGRTDQSMTFHWDECAGLFNGTLNQRSEFDRREQEREEADGIIAAIAEVEATGGYVPAATSGSRTALSVLKATNSLPESLRKSSAKRRFWRHVENLRLKGVIHEGKQRRASRHWTDTLTLKASNDGASEGASYASQSNPAALNHSGADATASYASHTQGGYRGARARNGGSD